jgi:hypothetical protein
MNSEGEIFYRDEYDQIYKSAWETDSFGQIDISTTIYQPYVWGRPDQGFVKNGQLFRLGVITEQRQLIRQMNGVYEVLASGANQYVDYFQTTFICESGPYDNFKHKLDCYFIDTDDYTVGIGPSWAEPEGSSGSIWGDPDVQTDQDLVWLDVWA